MANERSLLPENERLAIQRAMKELHAKHGSEPEVGSLLGISQQAVHKAAKRAEAGPIVQRALLKHLGMTVAELQKKYWPDPAPTAPKLSLVRSGEQDRYPNRAKAIEAIGDEVSPASIKELRSIALQSADDRPVSWWIDQLRAIDGRKGSTPMGHSDASPGDLD